MLVSDSTEFCNSSCSPKAAIPCSNRISWNTISEFNFFFKFLIRFYLVNLEGNVVIINIS